MYLIDTNIFIFAANGKLEEAALASLPVVRCSIVTTIEALGYHKLTTQELRALEALFANSSVLPLSDDIVQQAIKLRQMRKMELGDAVIAATALVYNLELWTNNLKDFKHILDLKLHNPLD